MKAVWIESGIVVNVTLWDEEASIPAGAEIRLVADETYVGPGCLVIGDEYQAPQRIIEQDQDSLEG